MATNDDIKNNDNNPIEKNLKEQFQKINSEVSAPDGLKKEVFNFYFVVMNIDRATYCQYFLLLFLSNEIDTIFNLIISSQNINLLHEAVLTKDRKGLS